MNESTIEEAALEYFAGLGYACLHGPDIAPGAAGEERASYREVVLVGRLERAVARLNPGISAAVQAEAVRRVVRPDGVSLVGVNRAFHRMLVDGVTVEIQRPDGTQSGVQVRVADFERPGANDWAVVSQLTVREGKHTRRPDLVVYLNGLPVGVVELKDIGKPGASIKEAFNQIETYKREIPGLFAFNEVVVLSDGRWARVGSLTAPFERFMPWRTVDGSTLVPAEALQLGPLVEGVFEPGRFLDLVQSFVAFLDGDDEPAKVLAAYHQFHAARTAVEATAQAARPGGDRRAGVVWHTQGSGKSLTMAFFAGKIARNEAMENPTVVVLTDRNDLDDQLFATFGKCQELLRQRPEQAESREDLQNRLRRASGGIIFTTMQKFLPDTQGARFPRLSERRNIVVMADEAHRGQYGFVQGFARHMRDALPNASFIGFTGTPVELEDRSTRAVFGEYISVYDIEQAIEDGATVPIYYESRLARLALDEELRPRLDEEFEAITGEEDEAARDRLKHRWAQLEALVGTEPRVRTVVEDLLAHFDRRQEVLRGKAMIVCISRRVCVQVYEAIRRLRPGWHSDRPDEGRIKIVMTGSAGDPPEYQPHILGKAGRELVAKRFKDPDDPLEVVIVCDMWLTGFDAPCVHTMYIDKPLHGHNLMQAIARVNRVFRDKPGGLVVDYLGIADSLRRALANYTASGGRGKPQLDVEEAVAVTYEKFEVCKQMLHGFDFGRYFEGTASRQMEVLQEAMNFVLGLEDGRRRFVKAVGDLSKAYALAGAHEAAVPIHDEVAFFQKLRGLLKSLSPEQERRREEVDAAVRQIVSRAVSSDEVVDVFALAGLEKPDISVLSEEFLSQIAHLDHKNLAVEMLQKLIDDAIRERARTNVVQSRTFSELLEGAVHRYQNRAIQAAQVIEELLEIARKMREAQARGEELGLNEAELAFYDALRVSDSAVKIMGDEVLRAIALELAEKVRTNVSLDWTVKKTAQARLRTMVKRILRNRGYPPDQQERAADTVLEQAVLYGDTWVAQLDEGTGDGPALRRLAPEEARPFENCVPLLDLEASGVFEAAMSAEAFAAHVLFAPDTEWVELPAHVQPRSESFVARLVGARAAEQGVRDGAYVLFRVEGGELRVVEVLG